MIGLIPVQFRLLALVAALGVAFVVGFAVNGWRVATKLSDLRRQHSDMIARINGDSLARHQALTAELDAKNKAITQIDLQRLKEAQAHAIEETELRAAIADGRKRLRIRATCNATSSVPATANAPGVDVSGTAELAEDARLAYFAHRAGIIETESELTACKKIGVILAGGSHE